MNTPTKDSKRKQWMWFAALWLAGLLAALTLGYTIKFLMGMI